MQPLQQPVVREKLDTKAAAEKPEDKTLRNTLKAMATLAVALAPQAKAAAAEVVQIETVQVVASPEAETETASVVDGVKSRVDGIKEKAENLKKRVDPNGFLDPYEAKVGEYDLRFTPVDLDLKPKWKDGKPALRFKGEFLETTLSKSRELGGEGDWTVRQGATAKLRGEVSTYDETELDLEAGLFREYRGTLGNGFEAKFQGNVGIRHRFMGDSEGLRVGMGFRQEIEGGNYEVFGQDFSLYAEGRQSIYHNIDTGETDASYKFMAGPKKDFDFTVFGKKGKLTLTVGPQIKGSSNGDAFDVGIGSKARVRF